MAIEHKITLDVSAYSYDEYTGKYILTTNDAEKLYQELKTVLGKPLDYQYYPGAISSPLINPTYPDLGAYYKNTTYNTTLAGDSIADK